MASLSNLPPELLSGIYYHLTTEELYRVTTTASSLNITLSHIELSARKCRLYGIDAFSKRSWKCSSCDHVECIKYILLRLSKIPEETTRGLLLRRLIGDPLDSEEDNPNLIYCADTAYLELDLNVIMGALYSCVEKGYTEIFSYYMSIGLDKFYELDDIVRDAYVLALTSLNIDVANRIEGVYPQLISDMITTHESSMLSLASELGRIDIYNHLLSKGASMSTTEVLPNI